MPRAGPRKGPGGSPAPALREFKEGPGVAQVGPEGGPLALGKAEARGEEPQEVSGGPRGGKAPQVG